MAGSAGKVSKNQTAAQRAVAGEAMSGKMCTKCGKEIKLKELVNVKHFDHGTGRAATAPYHKGCYGF